LDELQALFKSAVKLTTAWQGECLLDERLCLGVCFKDKAGTRGVTVSVVGDTESII